MQPNAKYIGFSTGAEASDITEMYTYILLLLMLIYAL